ENRVVGDIAQVVPDDLPAPVLSGGLKRLACRGKWRRRLSYPRGRRLLPACRRMNDHDRAVRASRVQPRYGRVGTEDRAVGTPVAPRAPPPSIPVDFRRHRFGEFLVLLTQADLRPPAVGEVIAEQGRSARGPID